MSIFAGIDTFHAAVRQKIADGEAGWAQSDIGGNIASYSRSTGWYGTGLNTGPDNPFLLKQFDELLLDVARGEGIASAEVFSRNYVTRKIADLRLFPDWNPKPHAQAKALEDFYINGAGQQYLYD